MASSLYVQYGCGLTAPPEWVNFDSSLTLRWERTPVLGRLWTKNPIRFPKSVRIGDICKGLPLPDGSCKGIYASHVLEHLSREEFRRALANSFKLLAPGGIFRLLMPDLTWIVREYSRRLESGDVDASHYFMEATELGESARPGGLFHLVFQAANTSRHRWLWNEASVRKALEECGFDRIRSCAFNDCEDPMFRFVEHKDRFERAVAMEARRP